MSQELPFGVDVWWMSGWSQIMPPISVPVFGRLVSQMMKTWLLLFWRDPTIIFQRFCLFVKQEDESDPSIALPSPVGDLPGMHIAHHHWKYYDQMMKCLFRRTSWSVNWSLFSSKASESYPLSLKILLPRQPWWKVCPAGQVDKSTGPCSDQKL